MAYPQLTLVERYAIYQQKYRGRWMTEIATQLGRSKSTLISFSLSLLAVFVAWASSDGLLVPFAEEAVFLMNISFSLCGSINFPIGNRSGA